MTADLESQIETLERQRYELGEKLAALRKRHKGREVPDYAFRTLEGETSLHALFEGKNLLFAIHNMGQACRYCTLWADGLNGFLPHLEDRFAVVLLSKDKPADQRRMANARGWRFRLASHGGGRYIREQSVIPGAKNMPGIVCYQRRGKAVWRKNAAVFGPGDAFCSFWDVLALAGHGPGTITPQYSYWQRPGKMEDGGENLRG